MSQISISKMEYKAETLKILEDYLQVRDYSDKNDLNKLIESSINNDLNKLVSELNTNKKRPYSEQDILKQIKQTFNGDKELNKKINVQNDAEIKEYFQDLFKETINYFELKDKAYKSDEAGSSVVFSFTHDFFELHEFRGRLTYSLDEVYASVKITTGSPYGLIFIFARPIYVPKVRQVVKVLLGERFKTKRITWSDGALRQIKNEYAKEVLSANANKVEGNIHVKATSQNLENKSLFSDMSSGEFTSITYDTKKYFPGNTVSINGSAGFIYSTLSDDDLISYIRDNLLKYANL